MTYILVERELVDSGPAAEVYIVWRGDRCQLLEFLAGLSVDDRDKVQRAVSRLADDGPMMNTAKFRKLHADVELWELKVGAIRIPLFRDGPRRFVLTHGFRKTTDRTPPTEIARAVRIREEYYAVYAS